MSFNKAKALKTASKYVQQGKYQSAIEEYRQIAQADPADVTTLNTLGDLYVKVGQTSEAIASFMHIAEHYRVSGFYLKAIAMLKKVSKLDSGNIDVSLKLAGLYAQQKLIVDARHQYLSVAEYYIREGQSQQALEIYQKIADLDPENTAVQIKLAEAFLRENQNDKAYDTFVLAAGEMRRQNKDNEALQTYLRAIKTQPRGQAALTSAVNLYLEREETGNAIELIEGLLHERPNDAELLTLLARIYQSTQKLEAAEAAIEKMLYTARSRYQYALDLGHSYVQRHDVMGALRVFDRVIEILHEYREEEKAAQLLRDILSVESQHLGALTRLAAVYEHTQDDHLLIETLNSLTDAALQVGSEPAAVSALKRLLELEPDEIQHRRRLRQLVGEEELPSESLSSKSYDRSLVSTADEDFWGQDESEPSAGSQPEVAANFSDYSGQGEESAQAVRDEELAAPQTTWEAHESGQMMEPHSFPILPETVEVEEVGSSSANLRDELESVDFYLHQGMLDVARYTLESIAAQYPQSPEIKAKFAQLQQAESQNAQTVFAPDRRTEVVEAVSLETPVVEATEVTEEPPTINSFGLQDLAPGYVASPVVTPDTIQDTEEATIFVVQPNDFSLGITTSYSLPETSEQVIVKPQETPRPAPSTPPSTSAPSNSFDLLTGDEMGDLLDFLDEFKAESEQHNPQEDLDTHYNLGLAYKEMDMFEEAIEEFQQAFKSIMSDTAHPHYVSCCNMLAFCFVQKGLPRLAVVWLKKALGAPLRDENVYQALRYDLAEAYAAMGEFKDAYETFAEIYAIDVQYRGVKTRMQEVAAQMAG
jgi:tetratricopeptide (TPR) repeat protein